MGPASPADAKPRSPQVGPTSRETPQRGPERPQRGPEMRRPKADSLVRVSLFELQTKF